MPSYATSRSLAAGEMTYSQEFTANIDLNLYHHLHIIWVRKAVGDLPTGRVRCCLGVETTWRPALDVCQHPWPTPPHDKRISINPITPTAQYLSLSTFGGNQMDSNTVLQMRNVDPASFEDALQLIDQLPKTRDEAGKIYFKAFGSLFAHVEKLEPSVRVLYRIMVEHSHKFPDEVVSKSWEYAYLPLEFFPS